MVLASSVNDTYKVIDGVNNEQCIKAKPGKKNKPQVEATDRKNARRPQAGSSKTIAQKWSYFSLAQACRQPAGRKPEQSFMPAWGKPDHTKQPFVWKFAG